MKLTRRPVEEPELNIINLVDVVLVLLVFFMLTSTFVKHGDVQIELPKAAAPAAQAARSAIVVAIDAKGHYYINGRRLTNGSADALKKTLAAAADGQFKRPLTIRADARTTHQSVVTAMDVAGELGFVHLNIVTTHTQSAT
ncbi:MAG TPA: biopolymer transporter ExbD [Gammaproteobacteria bacterium]|nr:biopolymer transporter ExbD [Gammaproteobacteria bacterium]